MHTRTTQSVIEELLLATYGVNPDERKQYMFLQALHGLVRLAKAERMLEIRMSVELASGGLAAVYGQRETKAILRKIGVGHGARQGHLEFGAKEGRDAD
jgi:hypothetical protein